MHHIEAVWNPPCSTGPACGRKLTKPSAPVPGHFANTPTRGSAHHLVAFKLIGRLWGEEGSSGGLEGGQLAAQGPRNASQGSTRALYDVLLPLIGYFLRFFTLDAGAQLCG
jgi:hypothetical protein